MSCRSPSPSPGWVLIRVKAFGLNRSELHTRLGLAEGVTFPRVLGIEATGVVAAAPGGEFEPGQQVADDDGRYGPHVRRRLRRVHLCARRPRSSRFAPSSTGRRSAPSPRCSRPPTARSPSASTPSPGQTLLIRGGTSSVGMAAAVLAKDRGLTVLSTTRQPERAGALAGDRRRPRRSSTTARSPAQVRRIAPGRRRRRARARRHPHPARHPARDRRPRRRLLHRHAEQPVDRARTSTRSATSPRRAAHRVRRRRHRPARRGPAVLPRRTSPPAG